MSEETVKKGQSGLDIVRARVADRASAVAQQRGRDTGKDTADKPSDPLAYLKRNHGADLSAKARASKKVGESAENRDPKAYIRERLQRQRTGTAPSSSKTGGRCV